MNENIKNIISSKIKYHSNKQKYGYFIGNDCVDICASDILDDVIKAGYSKQSEVLKDFIKRIEKKFGKSCSEEYQFTFIEMLSTELEELAEQYGKEEQNAKN